MKITTDVIDLNASSAIVLPKASGIVTKNKINPFYT